MHHTRDMTTTKTDLAKSIADLAALATEEPATKVLERALRFARGTRDITRSADVRAKVESVLRDSPPMSLREIIAAMREPANRVHEILRKLRAERCPTRSREDADGARQVVNVGEPDDPRWFWVIGDETTPEELSTAVRRLITHRPMTFSELTLATGARRGRLSGRLVQMQRDGERLENVGESDRIYHWHLKRGR